MRENPLKTKSKAFSLEIIKLYKELAYEKKEFVLSKQILRSGTSIGACICEAEYAQSLADFQHKNQIALKEANETRYWLELLSESDYIAEKEFVSLTLAIEEIIKMLIATINTIKEKQSNN